jgi:SpoVK/Ycf46/Vps4 family AAA+-type ATPase
MARRLAPALVAIEDVDLIASERHQVGHETNPLLFALLNEMDGIDAACRRRLLRQYGKPLGLTFSDPTNFVERTNARNESVPIIWVQHSAENLPQDSDGWQYVSELRILAGEPIVHSRFNIRRIFVTGAQTDNCVRATLHGAFTRGYDVILVSDAHTTEDFSEYGLPSADKVIAHTNMYWTWQTAPDRIASVVETADVRFA